MNSRGMTQLTRRRFLQAGSASLLGASVPGLRAQPQDRSDVPGEAAVLPDYLTREENFKNVGRGKPPPGDLPEPKRREVGLT